MRKRIDYKRVGRQILIFLFILALGLLNLKAQVVYAEDFSAVPNGTNFSPKWEFSSSQAMPEICWVASHQFECRNMRGEGVWTSALIDISEYSAVQASVQLLEKGQLDAEDYIRVYYNVDGKGEVLFSENGNKEGPFGTVWARQGNISGDELRIVINVYNNQMNERHLFDNIRIEGVPQSNLWAASTAPLWGAPENLTAGLTTSIHDDVTIDTEANAPARNVNDDQMIILPNPSEGSMKLKFNAPLPKVDVVVYNQNGMVNYNKTFFTQAFSGSVLDVPLRGKLAPGVYYMQVFTSEQDMIVQQIMIH